MTEPINPASRVGAAAESAPQAASRAESQEVSSRSLADRILPTPRLRRFVQLNIGLVLYGLAIALNVRADLGLSPWNVFNQGVSETFGISMGSVIVISSMVILLMWIPLRQRPGLGSVMNALLIGVWYQMIANRIPVVDDVSIRVLLLGAALLCLPLATACYLGAGLGPGPRDGLMTGIAARGYSLRVVRTGIEATVLTIGWFLGGTVGIGTVLTAFTVGPLIQWLLPRFVIHTDR